MTDRRAFLGLLTAAAAGLVLDPERLLWVPGRKTIFVMPPAPMRMVRLYDISTDTLGWYGVY